MVLEIGVCWLRALPGERVPEAGRMRRSVSRNWWSGGAKGEHCPVESGQGEVQQRCSPHCHFYPALLIIFLHVFSHPGGRGVLAENSAREECS